MTLLKRNNILANELLVYVGVNKGWLSINDAVTELLTDQFDFFDENSISELYIASEESREAFLRILQRNGNFSDKELIEGVWVWSVAFLNDIESKKVSVYEKLRSIAEIWALVDYPNNWKGFIYYMPISENEKGGEDKIYRKFVSFLREQNDQLKLLTYRK